MNYSPIVLFVYDRLPMLKECVNSLYRNELSKFSELYIFSDAAKNNASVARVEEVRLYIKSIDGFKQVHIIEQDSNKGLADSIIDGVTEVIKQWGKVIVLEDDLVVSENFLSFMNESLNFYEMNSLVYSIAGFSPKLNMPAGYKYDVYASYRASSWGWATWINRWEGIDWQVKDYDQFIANKLLVRKFNRGGIDLTRMLRHYQQGRNNSWAIRWCYDQFQKNMLTIYPVQSKVENIGFSPEGTHCQGINIYQAKLEDTCASNFRFMDDVRIEKKIIDDFKYQYSYTNKLLKRVYYFAQKFRRIFCEVT